MQLKERDRKLDISKLSPEHVNDMSVQIGEKIKKICDDACHEANRILNVYGMSAKMQIVIQHPDSKKQ